MTAARVLVLDHRDSFVFILVDQFAQAGAQVRTLRTHISLADLQKQISEFQPDLVLLSPGPGSPEQAGVMLPFLQSQPKLPVLGVCLGQQAMALAAGGEVSAAAQPMHGQASKLILHADPLFDGLGQSLTVARYHSLLVTRLPECMQAIAYTADAEAEIMAIRHRSLPQIGLQFHPESVLTPLGSKLLQRILQGACRYQQGDPSFFLPTQPSPKQMEPS